MNYIMILELKLFNNGHKDSVNSKPYDKRKQYLKINF